MKPRIMMIKVSSKALHAPRPQSESNLIAFEVLKILNLFSLALGI